MRLALGSYSVLGDLTGTRHQGVCRQLAVEVGASRMRKRNLRPPRARLRARAREVGAEMAPRGRASGRRAEVGVRAEVAG